MVGEVVFFYELNTAQVFFVEEIAVGQVVDCAHKLVGAVLTDVKNFIGKKDCILITEVL